MDESISRIVDYSSTLRYTHLTSDSIHACKRRIIDTFGCCLGAYDASPSVIARKVALRVEVSPGAHVIGTSHRTLPEFAAFANGVMGRYLDANDTYSGGGGHPSDVIPAVLAVAEAAGRDGKTAITAITLAYEVYHKLWQGMIDGATHKNLVRERGIDHVLYVAIGVAVGAGKALALDREQMANAVSLAVTPNIPLGITRRGNLSMWKGCAAGNASRNGVFAALLASEGMNGPAEAIEGAKGLRSLLGKCEISPFTAEVDSFRIAHSNLKYFASEYHSQSAITAALELCRQVRVADIEKIAVHTYWYAWSETGSEPEKWHPTTRETADHSLPFIIAAVMIDGRFSHEIFSEERLRDQRIHSLTDKISIEEDPELTKKFPQQFPCRIEVTTKDGTLRIAEVDFGRGHVKNPMTDDEVNAKFHDLAERLLPKNEREAALERLWNIDKATDLGPIFDSMNVTKPLR